MFPILQGYWHGKLKVTAWYVCAKACGIFVVIRYMFHSRSHVWFLHVQSHGFKSKSTNVNKLTSASAYDSLVIRCCWVGLSSYYLAPFSLSLSVDCSTVITFNLPY